MRRHFEREIESLNKQLLLIGGRVEDAINIAVQGLFERKVEVAREVATIDEEIDERELRLEEECLKILALYNPVASDLRFIISVVKINNDLERMGDLALNLAETATLLAEQPPVELPPRLREMSEHVKKMVKGALDALVKEDAEAAIDVTDMDSEADQTYRDMRTLYAEKMKAQPDSIDRLMPLISVCRYLERIADHATNIAEDVYYLVRGDIIRHNVEKFSGK